MDNQQSYWYTGQLVTALQMNDFSRDLYTRFTELTQQQSPCILNMDLSLLTQTLGNVSVPAGSFRFPDVIYPFLLYDTGIFGNAPALVVAVTGDGFIVARYAVTPTSPSQTNYTFPTAYLFVTTINPVTDVVVCTITAGVISSTGKFFNYFPDITDTGGLVSIIGANGLSVTNHIACNTLNSGGNVGVGGTLGVTGTGIFGGSITVGINATISGSSFFNIISGRGGVTIFPNSSNTAYLGSNNTSTGGYNGFIFDDTLGRARLSVANAPTDGREVVCFSDLAIVQQFSAIDTAGNTWLLQCQSFSGPFPSNTFSIIGNSFYAFPGGGGTTNIDLATAGIAAVAATLTIFGTTSETDYNNNLASLSVNSSASSTSLIITTTGVPAGGTNNIQFQLTYK